MKKRIMSLVLGAILVVCSIGVAFATQEDTQTNNGAMGQSGQNISVDELLKTKLDRIDELVKEGRFTKEKGEEYKKIITDRMNNCTNVGENRGKYERLGIGFGKGKGLGQGKGQRPCGRGNGACMRIANES
ncbi:MAG: hypothetical protein N4A57_04285 [Anaeromicrobium sp.]|jgi:hypothetical protein|uniref:hypothetical protein n=1 Tax=Anaeromicrobium sp. TaxID=1929132 RepID=UPI0025E047C3|nr:hypothetical protein [Anaeromicrobium sp.]MCT4593475.1 hypothetical protein [Anaeromicrobium sp.]